MGPILGMWIGPTLEVPKWSIVIGPQLLGSSAAVWYGMHIDFLNGALWMRFHGRYRYQSFISGSNILGVDRTEPCGPEMVHPSLGRIYLVIVPPYDMSCALMLFTGIYRWVSMADIDLIPSSMGPISGVWIGPTLGVSRLTIRHWAVAIW